MSQPLVFSFAPETDKMCDRADRDCGSDINNRMLFYKNRGERDQNSRCSEGDLYSSAEILAMKRGQHHRKRAYDVYRRADVGIRIEGIILRHKPRQNIIPLEFRGAKVLTGRKNEIDHYSRGVSDHNEIHHFSERRNVVDQRIYVHPYQIHEPEKIWDEK